MTSDKARKAAIRQRMAVTGEPYSVARKATEAQPAGPGSGEALEEGYVRQAEEAGASKAERVAQLRQAAELARERADQAEETAMDAEELADEAEDLGVDEDLEKASAGPRPGSRRMPFPPRPPRPPVPPRPPWLA